MSSLCVSSSRVDDDTTSVDADISLLKQSTNHLDSVLKSLESIAADAPWKDLGYFDSSQHDKIEHLFFRFMVSRGVLVSLALHAGDGHQVLTPNNSNGDVLQSALARAESSFSDEGIPDTTHTLRTRIILCSALALFVYEARFVKCFQYDSIAIAKLNQQFYRSDIEPDTYNKLRLECTDSKSDGRVSSLVNAYNLLYFNEGESIEVTDNDESMALSNLTEQMVLEANTLIEEILQLQSRPAIKFKIKLLHAPIVNVARAAKRGTKVVLRETRAQTFKGVSRLKSPVAHLIKFSKQQHEEVLKILQPGDMIFTYTAGYMSDVFIPGCFKHGITYVGSPEERKEAGLNADNIARIFDDLPEGEAQKLLAHFSTSKLQTRDKEPLAANVIEAVAEGVIFNNLSLLLDTHVNRLLVLRPNITSEERTDALMNIFRFLGNKYDFGFNFADTSAVVCTEIQYHAFNGKGQLKFALTKHAGHLALSADDIVNYYLKQPGSFDFVLLAVEDKESTCYQSKLYIGDDGDGIKVLTKLMEAESK